MTIEAGDSARGRELAARSAHVRRRLVLEDVSQQLGELQTIEHAQKWLKQAFLWAAAEKVSGSRALAMVSAIREWVKAFDSALDRDRMVVLERRIRELEAELRERGRAP